VPIEQQFDDKKGPGDWLSRGSLDRWGGGVRVEMAPSCSSPSDLLGVDPAAY
jgi:hypothetical protein